MIQLTDQEKEKVFAMYLGCEVKTGVTATAFLSASDDTNELISIRTLINIPADKLLLTPLSKISDEHAIRSAKIHYTIFKGQSEVSYDSRQQLIKHGSKVAKLCYTAELCQQLVMWGYAVPLWFGIDHPANGKTAIELGLAIDKPF